MDQGTSRGRVYAPVPVVAASALLWAQGAIWAALGSLDVAFGPAKTPLNDLLITVFFGFTALSAVLAVRLPRPSGERARAAAAALHCFMAGLSLAVLVALVVLPGLWAFLADAGLFALAGAIMAACAAGGLRSGAARAFYRPGAAAR